MNAVLQMYIPGVVHLALVVVLVCLGWVFQVSWKWIEAHTSAKTQSLIGELAKEAYAYAENYLQGSSGQAKLDGALNWLSQRVNLKKIGLSQTDLIGAIQKAWQDYNPGKTPKVTQGTLPQDVLNVVQQMINQQQKGDPNKPIVTQQDVNNRNS